MEDFICSLSPGSLWSTAETPGKLYTQSRTKAQSKQAQKHFTECHLFGGPLWTRKLRPSADSSTMTFRVTLIWIVVVTTSLHLFPPLPGESEDLAKEAGKRRHPGGLM